MKMHICLVGIEYPTDTAFGGIATYQKRMADSLIALGHKVTVICGSEEREKDYFEDGIHVIRLYTSREKETVDSFNNYRNLVKQKIMEIDKLDKIDIIETPEFSGEITDFLRVHNIPVVVKLHTSYRLWAKLNNVDINNELSQKIIEAENLCMKYADKYVSCSEILQNVMHNDYPELNFKNIGVLPNPANITDFYPLRNNHNSKTIIYCGSFEKRKGIFILAKAIPSIIDRIQDVDLKIQIISRLNGNLPKKQFLDIIPEKYHKHIEFLGHIENNKLNDYFNKARIGIIPSLFDNLPYVAMEELLTELPIVASNNTGIREMITDHDSGILYDPNDSEALADAVIELYNNKKQAKKYGKKGRQEILKKYSPDIVAKKAIEIYEQTIKDYNNQKRMKMHVCLINFEYPTETSLGGIATYQKRMANALYNAGCKVTVICGSFDKYQEYYENGIHVYRIPKKFPYQNLDNYYDYRISLKNKIEEINQFDKIDIIEAPEISAELISYLSKREIPIVTKLHTSYTIVKQLNQISMFPTEVEKEIFHNENIMLNKSDKVVCCSEILRNLIPIYHKKNKIDDISIVPNPANTKDFYPLRNNHNSKTIIYCGNFTKRKGIFILAKAIPRIIDSIQDENLKVQIIGDFNNVEQNGNSPKEQFLEIVPKKYHKHIEFLGYIENNKLNEYFNKARIGIIPSLFDNLPYVAMEELLTELPIVASNNTGIREMITDHDSGILYDPNDSEALAMAVIELYNNEKQAKEYGKKGRQEILKKYSPNVIAKQSIQLYEQTIREFMYRKVLKEICEKYNIKILGKLRHGGANVVRKCLYDNNKCILKIYYKDKNYNFDLIDYVLEKLDHANKIIFKTKYLECDIYLYSFMDGKHLKKYSNKQLQKVVNSIEKISKIDIEASKTKNSIYDKYYKYRNYFKENQTAFDKIVISNLLKYDEIYGKNIGNNCIVHGDLAPTNVIWNEDTPFLVDFDECTYAPVEYEYMSFLIKTCFYNNNFDIKIALSILNILIDKKYDIKRLKNCFYFYILKVLFEKLYFCESSGLDLNDEKQRLDFWKWWYDLLIDKNIEKTLFKNIKVVK